MDFGKEINKYLALAGLIAFILLSTGVETKYSTIVVAITLIASLIQNWKGL